MQIEKENTKNSKASFCPAFELAKYIGIAIILAVRALSSVG